MIQQLKYGLTFIFCMLSMNTILAQQVTSQIHNASDFTIALCESYTHSGEQICSGCQSSGKWILLGGKGTYTSDKNTNFDVCSLWFLVTPQYGTTLTNYGGCYKITGEPSHPGIDTCD